MKGVRASYYFSRFAAAIFNKFCDSLRLHIFEESLRNVLIEQLLIFILGFFCATLIGLMIVPALSRRAMRLSRRRLELQLPLSPAEILAERDQLRAEYAVAQRQTERKYETAQVAQAEATGELGRRTAQLVTLQGEHATLSDAMKTTSTALNQTTLNLRDSEAQSGTHALALYDESQRHAALNARHSDLQRSHNQQSDQIDDLTTRLAGVEAAKAGLEIHIEDMKHHLLDGQHQIAKVDAENELLNRELQLAKYEAENSARLREKLAESLAASKAEALTLHERTSKADQRLKRQTQDLADLRGLNEALQTSYDHQHARHTNAMQEHLSVAQGWQQQIENLRAEVAALEGALSASRDKAQAKFQRTELPLTGASQNEIALLRNAITDLAAEVVRQKTKDESGAAILEQLSQSSKALRPRGKTSKSQSLAEKILAKD